MLEMTPSLLTWSLVLRHTLLKSHVQAVTCTTANKLRNYQLSFVKNKKGLNDEQHGAVDKT